MKLGGLVGTLTLARPPSLRSAAPHGQVLHAGKGATFGLGKVEVAPGAALSCSWDARESPEGA